MEAYEYLIMKALLKRLYQNNLISAETYSQTANRLDSLLDKAATPSDTTPNGKGAPHPDGTVSNPRAAADGSQHPANPVAGHILRQGID